MIDDHHQASKRCFHDGLGQFGIISPQYQDFIISELGDQLRVLQRRDESYPVVNTKPRRQISGYGQQRAAANHSQQHVLTRGNGFNDWCRITPRDKTAYPQQAQIIASAIRSIFMANRLRLRRYDIGQNNSAVAHRL